MFTIEKTLFGFMIFTPSGNPVFANGRPLYIQRRASAEAKAEWLSASPETMAKAERRELRQKLADRIGMPHVRAVGFFN